MSRAARPVGEALRRLLHTGQQDAARLLPELLPQAQEIIAAARGPQGALGEAAAAAGECVCLLAACLRTQRDPLLMNRLFQALVMAGRLGRAYAAQHVQSRALPLPQFSALLQALPGRDFLAMLNDMLLDSPSDDKQLAAWLRTLLPAPGRLDGREALHFLKTLAPSAGDEGAALARPLREALLAAGLSEGLMQALAGSPRPATAEVLLLAVESLAAPPMQAEALAYALRAAGTQGPNLLPPLLAAPPSLEPRDAALAMEMRRQALGPDAPAQLFGAAQTEPEMLGLVLADLMADGGPHAQAALRLIPLLPRLGVESALAALPQEEHGAVYARLLYSLAVLDPDFLRRAAKVVGPVLGLEGAAAQALAELLRSGSGHGASALLATAAWDKSFAPAGPAQSPPKSASRRTNLAESLRNTGSQLKDQDFSHASVSGEVVENVSLSGTDLSHSRFTGVVFRRVRISASQLCACAFEDCVFQSCAFSGADFAHSHFRACRLSDVSLEGCDLSHARLEGCALAACTLADTSLAGAWLVKTRLDSLTLRTSSLAGGRILECALARVGFARCELTGLLLEKSVCRELEIAACTLDHGRVLGCECLDLGVTRSPAPGLFVLGGHTNNPRLARAEAATRARCAHGACSEQIELDPALREGPGAAFVRASVDVFLRVDEARRTLNAMRGQDQRRRELALERLSEPQAQLMALLPALLATNVFERAQNIADVPFCVIAGHARQGLSTREQRAQLERLFPGHSLPRAAKELPEPALVLEAVYAIGSLGSVAQRPSSDVDCWVCVSPGPVCGTDAANFAAARAGLARKLAALETWAWDLFGLEMHFFPMAMEDVRQNNFGMSDKESSGSAQAALLKEEFYRTALKLAGRDLLWWAAPPTAAQSEAKVLLDELSRLAPRTAAELVDLGQPQPIPPQEYFGACLWQMVKALHSPYKSVMKLGLLEKYADQGQDTRLLCDRIKEAVLRGRRLAEDVDPYLSLFTSIHKHYRQQQSEGSLALIGECLRLKADVAPEDLPAEFAAPALAAPAGAEAGAFAAALRLGVLVNQFMISAYRRIQEGLRAHQGAAQISPEDLTRLGRRIAANFAQHPHKVSLVPFLSDEIAFTELFFYAEKAPGKRTVWGVKGKDKDSGKAAVESLAPIRRDTDVVRLLAWLLFNGLYDPRQVLQAERSIAPIALLDLQALLADVAAFFPRRATLEPDLDEYLKPERVVRAYVIANLPVPTDKNKLLTASVLYATNWGEVFAQTFDNPPLTLQKASLAFLRENLARPITPHTELRVFQPKKSATPRLKLG